MEISSGPNINPIKPNKLIPIMTPNTGDERMYITDLFCQRKTKDIIYCTYYSKPVYEHEYSFAGIASWRKR
jgi:hypothetical protein